MEIPKWATEHDSRLEITEEKIEEYSFERLAEILGWPMNDEGIISIESDATEMSLLRNGNTLYVIGIKNGKRSTVSSIENPIAIYSFRACMKDPKDLNDPSMPNNPDLAVHIISEHGHLCFEPEDPDFFYTEII